MDGRALGLIGAAVLATLTLACSSETTVLRSDQESQGITVTGSGSSFGEPDVAMVSLGVDAQAASVGEARSQAAKRMNAILQALKDGGVAEDDLQTTRFSVQAVYDFSNQRQELIGFSVQNMVTAKIRTIDDTGALVDAALTAGGDLTRIDNIQFTIDDPTALEDQAREQAMREAKRKAETLAREGGVELGPPRAISEGGGPMPIPFEGRALQAADEAGTPIELGELEVRVDVQVVYSLRE